MTDTIPAQLRFQLNVSLDAVATWAARAREADPGALPTFDPFDPLKVGGEVNRLWQNVIDRSRTIAASYDALMVTADIESETPGPLVLLPPVPPGPELEGRES